MTSQHTPPADRHLRYRLANYRSLRGMTQQNVADQVGVTREYVSMIEGGRRRADGYQLLTALASALGVDVTALTTCRPGTADQPPQQAATLRLHLHELSATIEPAPTGNGNAIVLSDGVLRIELIPGPDDTTKQTRDGALRIGRAIGAYLSRAAIIERHDGRQSGGSHD